MSFVYFLQVVSEMFFISLHTFSFNSSLDSGLLQDIRKKKKSIEDKSGLWGGQLITQVWI